MMRTALKFLSSILLASALALDLSHALDDLTPEQNKFSRAIWEEDVPMIEQLIKTGTKVNTPLGPLGSPLSRAISANKPAIVKLLLSKGADPLLRDSNDSLPIESLRMISEGAITPLIKALTREQTAEEKKALMRIPIPVWRSVLGKEPVKLRAGEKPQQIPFITINDKDPTAEMTPLLDRQFPGWKPGSAAKDDRNDRPLRVLIQLTKTNTKKIPKENEGLLCDYLRNHELPAYEFFFSKSSGPLSGGGREGFVVLLGGTWMIALRTSMVF